MDCKKILQELNLYIDGELEEALCQQLQAHLRDCDRCRIVLDTTRKTIEIYRDQTPMDLPVDVRDRLHASLRSRWRKP
jgi:predicted anti-sigma-YlaC factor YlaD